MKHLSLSVALVMVLAALGASSPATAQIPVTDAAHIAATQNQTFRDEFEWIEKLWYLVENYKRLEDAYFRDSQDIIDAVSGALHYEDSQTVAGEHARKLYEAVFSDDLTIRPCPDGTWNEQHVFTDEWLLGGDFDCVSADDWEEYWRQVKHDTFYGVLDGTWQIREDIWRAGPELEELRQQLVGATGNAQTLQAIGAIEAAQLEETRRLNDQLILLTQLQVSQASYQQTAENAAANTTRELVYWDGWDEPLPYGTFSAMPRLGESSASDN